MPPGQGILGGLMIEIRSIAINAIMAGQAFEGEIDHMLKHRLILKLHMTFGTCEVVEGPERIDMAVLTLEGAAVPVG